MYVLYGTSSIINYYILRSTHVHVVGRLSQKTFNFETSHTCTNEMQAPGVLSGMQIVLLDTCLQGNSHSVGGDNKKQSLPQPNTYTEIIITHSTVATYTTLN